MSTKEALIPWFQGALMRRLARYSFHAVEIGDGSCRLTVQLEPIGGMPPGVVRA